MRRGGPGCSPTGKIDFSLDRVSLVQRAEDRLRNEQLRSAIQALSRAFAEYERRTPSSLSGVPDVWRDLQKHMQTLTSLRADAKKISLLKRVRKVLNHKGEHWKRPAMEGLERSFAEYQRLLMASSPDAAAARGKMQEHLRTLAILGVTGKSESLVGDAQAFLRQEAGSPRDDRIRRGVQKILERLATQKGAPHRDAGR